MKILFIACVVTVFTSVYFIRKSGYNPKPILTMKASVYNSEVELGNALFRRFFKEAQSIKNFYIFCEKDECNKLNIWQSFLLASKQHNLNARNIVLNDGVNFQSSFSSVNSEYTINFYPISGDKQLIKDNKGLFFYMVDFFVSKNQEPEGLECENKVDINNLNCLALNFSRRFYKKKFDINNTHVGMEKISHNKYIIYLN